MPILEQETSEKMILMVNAAIFGLASYFAMIWILYVDYYIVTFIGCLLSTILAIFTVIVFFISNKQYLEISGFAAIIGLIFWFIGLIVYIVRDESRSETFRSIVFMAYFGFSTFFHFTYGVGPIKGNN